MPVSRSEIADVLEVVVQLLRKETVETTPIENEKYPADFVAAVKIVLEDEGGYSNDPNDPGGETNFGISKRSHPGLDIKNLTRDGAIEIYYNEYWVAYRLDLFAAAIGSKLFNTGVNTGMKQAVKFLQRAVGVRDDGVIGSVTRSAVNRGDVNLILNSMRDQQKQFYRDLVRARPSSIIFLNGWLRRAER